MESQNPKVAMYVKRSFGEKLNASFDFIKESWKPLLKFTTYLILPICLIQAMSLNGLMGGALDLSHMTEAGVVPTGFADLGVMFLVNYAAYFFLYIIGTVLLTSMVYAVMRTYNESEDRLQGITLGALKALLLYNIKRLFILTLVGVLLMLLALMVVGFLAGATLFSLILTIPLLIACSVPLALLAPIYVFENISIMEAIKKTFRLGFATWGGILLISFIMGIIASVLQGVTMTPWYIATLVKYFFAMSDTGDATTVSAGYSFLLYLLAIVQTFGAYLSAIFSMIGIAYQYGHATEVVDSITIESDIDNFDKL